MLNVNGISNVLVFESLPDGVWSIGGVVCKLCMNLSQNVCHCSAHEISFSRLDVLW